MGFTILNGETLLPGPGPQGGTPLLFTKLSSCGTEAQAWKDGIRKTREFCAEGRTQNMSLKLPTVNPGQSAFSRFKGFNLPGSC